MKYQVGQRLYRNNKKSGELEELEIVDILYVLSRSVKSKYNYNEKDLNQLIENKVILDDIEGAKQEAIRQLEEQFGIKLKEV